MFPTAYYQHFVHPLHVSMESTLEDVLGFDEVVPRDELVHVAGHLRVAKTALDQLATQLCGGRTERHWVRSELRALQNTLATVQAHVQQLGVITPIVLTLLIMRRMVQSAVEFTCLIQNPPV